MVLLLALLVVDLYQTSQSPNLPPPLFFFWALLLP